MKFYKAAGKVLLILFLLITVCSLCLWAQTPSYIIVIKDKTSGQFLEGASVISLNSSFRNNTDSTGRLAIPLSIIRNKEELQVSMVGHVTRIISAEEISRGLAIELETDISMLEEVIVSDVSPLRKVSDIQMGTESITALEAKKLPAILGEVDIIKLLQLKPGVKSAGEGLAGFYVRGGGADQNLILVDNAPVYNPNHLLGLFSVFNVDAVREVKLYKSAFPSRYSGRLSSVLDVSMRAASFDSVEVNGGIGLLSSRVSVETPISKGRSSIILSGRRTYFDLLTNLMNDIKKGDSSFEAIPGYFFADLNLRTDFRINSNNLLWATAYWGADNFVSPPDETTTTKFTWGNRTASVNWKHMVDQGMDIISSLFYSGYQYRLRNEFDFNEMEIKSGIQTAGVKLIANIETSTAMSYQAGMDGMLHYLRIGDFKSSSDLSEYSTGEIANGNEWGAFFNSEYDKNGKWALLGGVRLSGFAAGSKINLNVEPRFSVRYQINDQTAVKASATRMYQYLHLASLSSASLPTDMWYPSTNKTKPQYANQVSIGISRALRNNSLYFSLEGYYKSMYNQVEFRDGADVFGNPKLENDFVFGKANAYGLETYIEKKTGRTTGWIGYTLSLVNRIFPDINEGKAFYPRYDRRHDISVVFIHKINKKFSLSGNWIFGSGSRITVPIGRYVFQDMIGDRPERITPVFGQRGNYQLAPVHRMDLSLVMALKSRKGSQDLTFSLYNAYSRRNPFYIQFREIDDERGFAVGIEPTLISLFPVLPGITYNFKF